MEAIVSPPCPRWVKTENLWSSFASMEGMGFSSSWRLSWSYSGGGSKHHIKGGSNSWEAEDSSLEDLQVTQGDLLVG